MGGNCDPQLATRRAAQVYVSVRDIQQGRCRGAVPASLNEPAGSLSYGCYLLARQVLCGLAGRWWCFGGCKSMTGWLYVATQLPRGILKDP